jgi:DNA helicase IV
VSGVSKLEEMRFTEADVPILDEARSLLHGVPTTYAHVIVDEAQDLSPLQLHCIARRARGGSMTLLGDIAQRKGAWAYATWGELFSAVGQPQGGLEELAVSYRVPSEVLDLASGLFRRVAPGLRIPRGLRPAAGPLLVGALPAQKVELGLRGVVERFAREPGQLAVICPNESLASALAAVRETIPTASRDDLTSPAVVLTTVEAAGLEFDNVIVLHPDRIGTDGATGMSRLLVAVTRARQHLAVIGEAIPKELRHGAAHLGAKCTSDIPIGARKLARSKHHRTPERPRKRPRDQKSQDKPKPRAPRIDWTKASGKGELGEDYKGWWTGG